MTEEQRLKRNAYMREYMKRHVAKMTPEQLATFKAKRRLQEKRRHANNPVSLEKSRKAKREYMRRWKASLTPDQLASFNATRTAREVPRQRERRRNDGGKHAAWTKSAYWKKPEKYRARQKEYRDELKLQTLEAYGTICKCCGEDEPVFLSIDHIKGDGAKHRKQFTKSSGLPFYTWLRKNGFPSGFQVLCYNCNFAKRTGDECPHRKIVMSRILSNISKKGGGA